MEGKCMGENIFANDMSSKELLLTFYEELIIINAKKPNHSI